MISPQRGETAMGFGGSDSSFVAHLARTAPGALPAASAASNGAGIGSADVPHGTTIVAVAFDGGVLLAGDRRATMGHLIAQRDIRKTFVTDHLTAVGIAGTAGIAKQIVKLFTVELEHYEKIEGVPLTFEGKANRLGGMVRGNFSAALQGLVAVPLLTGFDERAGHGRIVSYDVTGDWHDEIGFHAIGSGSAWAKSSIKKRFRLGLDSTGALEVAAEALFDAADDDTATGGPDVLRQLYPTAIAITADGADELAEDAVIAATEAVIARRTQGEELP